MENYLKWSRFCPSTVFYQFSVKFDFFFEQETLFGKGKSQSPKQNMLQLQVRPANLFLSNSLCLYLMKSSPSKVADLQVRRACLQRAHCSADTPHITLINFSDDFEASLNESIVSVLFRPGASNHFILGHISITVYVKGPLVTVNMQ